MIDDDVSLSSSTGRQCVGLIRRQSSERRSVSGDCRRVAPNEKLPSSRGHCGDTLLVAGDGLVCCDTTGSAPTGMTMTPLGSFFTDWLDDTSVTKQE
jgi:hypothetical protein